MIPDLDLVPPHRRRPPSSSRANPLRHCPSPLAKPQSPQLPPKVFSSDSQSPLPPKFNGARPQAQLESSGLRVSSVQFLPDLSWRGRGRLRHNRCTRLLGISPRWPVIVVTICGGHSVRKASWKRVRSNQSWTSPRGRWVPFSPSWSCS